MHHQAGTGNALPMAGPEHHNARTSFPLARLKHQIRWTSLPMAGPRLQLRRTSLPMAGPATRFGTYKVTEWREGVQPQKTWIQKRIWKPRSSRFSSPTSIVCQGLVQTGLALHPMSRNRWSLKISSLKMFRLQCGLFLTQDVSPAVWGWRLLNARCFAYSCGMAPSCLPFEHCNINFSCHSNIALWSAIL